jgi:hypothetical protein
MEYARIVTAGLTLLLGSWSALHALPSGLAGNTTVSMENVFYSDTQDTDNVQQLIDGVKVPVNLVLMGRQSGWDYNLVSNFYLNQWNENKVKFDLATLSLRGKLAGNDANFILGDTYFRKSPYTIMNRKIRGLSGQTTLLRPTSGKDDLLALNFVLGQSKEAQDTGSHIANQNYRRIATTGTYRQYLGAGVLRGKPLPDLNVDATVLHAFDDSTSIKAQTSGIKNTLFGAHFDYAFYKQQLVVDGLFDRSNYDDNILDNLAAKNDNAFRAALDGRLENGLKFGGSFDYVGPQYFTAGYPYLENDRMGFGANLGYTKKGWWQAEAIFNDYVTNLADSANKHATRTDQIDLSAVTAWNKNPNLNAGYTFKRENSPELVDRTLVDRLTHTVSIGADVSWEKLRGSFSVSEKLIADNSQLYIAVGSTVDSTIFAKTNQLSFSTSLRYRPSARLTFMAGANNIINTATPRTGQDVQKALINYVYLSTVASLGQRRYIPTLDLIYSNYLDQADDANTRHYFKTKAALEYKVNKANSAKLYYGFEDSFKNEAGSLVSDYVANRIGLEYTVLF